MGPVSSISKFCFGCTFLLSVLQIIAICLIEVIVVFKVLYLLENLGAHPDRCMMYSLSAFENNYELPIVCKLLRHTLSYFSGLMLAD